MVIDNKRINLYVIGLDTKASSWLNINIVHNIYDADIVLVATGADVNPSLYDEQIGSFTKVNTERDIYELTQINTANKAGKKIIGIGRGLQLLNVCAGGKLIQHMTHPKKHLVRFYDGTRQYVSSTHHQLSKPFNLPKDEYHIIAYAEGESDTYLNGYDSIVMMPRTTNEKCIEPEIIYYPKLNALGFQFDPNTLSLNSKTLDVAIVLVRLLLEDKLKTVLQLGIPIKRLIETKFKFTQDEIAIINDMENKNIVKVEYVEEVIN